MMYTPSHFEETRIEVLHGLMRKHPLAAVVTTEKSGCVANHVPIEVDASASPLGTLSGHFARANPAWRDHDPEREVLVIFQGPDSYISPSWYPSKRETGKALPTWNYAVVHAYGPLRVIDDVVWLRGFLNRLTDTNEAGRPDRWRIDDAPPDYVEKLLHGIVGFEIPIARAQGKWKMSQNRTREDRRGAAAGARCEGEPGAAAVAALMERFEG